MANIISDFAQFSNESNIIDLDDIFSLNENGSSVKYSKEEFKNIFRGPLLESEGSVDESLLEKAHAYYEMSMLYENKSHWIEDKGKFMYLDSDTHMILIKNGEGFVIEKSTFDVANNINEWGIGWSDIEAGWNKVKSVSKSIIKKTASVVKGGWETLSYGAQKAWEFVKTCGNVIIEFVKGMTWIEWAALAMSVLSAILGICGAIAAGSAVFAWLTPILGTIAGVFQAIGGGLHLYEGSVKIKNATKLFNKNPTISPTTKMIATITQGLPEYVVGGGMIALGVYDVTKSATSIIDPSSGAQSVATGVSVKSSLIGVGKSIAKPGGAVHHFIEHAGLSVMKKAGIKVASEAGKEAVGKIFTAVISTVSSSMLSSVLGWIWEFILKAGQGITKGLDFLINIPSKISNSIGNFVKKADTVFTKIIAKGLNKLVKPLTDSASKVISKYIQPTVNSVKSWFDKEIKSYNEALIILKEYKHELHTGISHHAVKKPGEKDSHNPVSPKHKIDDKKVTKKDVKIIKKSIAKAKGKIEKKKEKVKESQIWEMKYLRSFDDLKFI
jgi:hypothetical protein